MYQLGLIGYPVKHSLSPWIHGQFLKKANVKGNYSLIEINPEEFENDIAKLKTSELNGFNITVPFKEKIIPYLDEVDQEAKQIGAVNTVLNKDGKWIGFNTDGKGYVRSLNNFYPTLFKNKDKSILLLGAGGAARGIYYALLQEGFYHIDIANRTQESAMEIKQLNNTETKTKVISLHHAEESIRMYDVIIQTTSVGMSPNINQSIVTLNDIKRETIVSDIVYQPIMTNILKQAQNKGAQIHFGHTMLLYQAQYAFEIWTNQRVPIGDMDTELKLILEG